MGSGKEIYLDNAATTACYAEAAETVRNMMLEDYGNPSSMHVKGIEAERHVKEATGTLASLLRVKEKEIFYTSGGTESDNWAVLGCARANARRGRHIITTPIEHPAVKEPVKALEDEGFEVTVIPVDREGLIDPEQIAEAVRGDTVLVSVMHVNNEIGTVEPVAEIGRAVKRVNPDTLFHVDAVQSFGKIPVFPSRMDIDLLSVSGHKIHGPKGTGLLYIREGVKIRPLILGGGQQKGMRSGTDNVPGIAGLAAAAAKICAAREENARRMLACRKKLAEGLLGLGGVVLHGPVDLPGADGDGDDVMRGAPHILNASVTGIRSEVLLHTLEERGIFVSSGSACSSHKRAPSAVLTAIGCPKEEIGSAVRFSFSEWTSEEDIDITLDVLRETVPLLRRFVRK